MKYLVVLLMCSGASLADGAQPPSKYPGLSSLVGHCFQAPFPQGGAIDTHCFSDLYQGQFIVDNHLVCGDGKNYRGKTIYAVRADDQKVIYRYHNSLGGFSDGEVTFDAGVLHFPEESYQQKNGSAKVYRTQWKLNESGYQSVMDERMPSGEWKAIWQMDFEKTSEQDAVAQVDAIGQLQCKQLQPLPEG